METIELDEKHIQAHVELGLLYYHRKQLDRAEEIWKKATAYGKNPELENNLGMIYLERNELSKAEKHFKNAVAINKDFLNANYNLGVLYQKMKKFDYNSARRFLEKKRTRQGKFSK